MNSPITSAIPTQAYAGYGSRAEGEEEDLGNVNLGGYAGSAGSFDPNLQKSSSNNHDRNNQGDNSGRSSRDGGRDGIRDKIGLDIRGRKYVLDKQVLDGFPETLLAMMFPAAGVSGGGRGNDGSGMMGGMGGGGLLGTARVDLETEYSTGAIREHLAGNEGSRTKTKKKSKSKDTDTCTESSNNAQPNKVIQDSEEQQAQDESERRSRVLAPIEFYWVDVDVGLLEYVFRFYKESIIKEEDGSNEWEEMNSRQAEYNKIAGGMGLGIGIGSRQKAVIMLKEDLEYFVIPNSGKCKGDIGNVNGYYIEGAKTKCGELLVKSDLVFEGLSSIIHGGANKDGISGSVSSNDANLELGLEPGLEPGSGAGSGGVEQQLIEMLCCSGFNLQSRWGYRKLEDNRMSISSLSLVAMQPIIQNSVGSSSGSSYDDDIGGGVSSVSQKLFLFFKKPARKCWWERRNVNLGKSNVGGNGGEEGEEGLRIDVKLWCRRVWTLELAISFV